MASSLRKTIWISSGVMGGSLIVFLIIFLSIIGGMDDAILAIKNANTIIGEQAKATETLADLKLDAPKADQYQAKLKNLLPKKEELLGIKRSIDSAARVRNVTFNFSFTGGESAATAEAPGYIPFSIQVEGAYNDIQDFFVDLESKSTRFVVSFDSFSWQAISGGYRASAQGKTYFRSL